LTETPNYNFYEGGIHKFVQRYIHNLPSLAGKTVLDIPCGAGRASLEFLKKGAEVHAFDLFPEFLKLENIEAQYADLSKPLPCEDNSYDYIICEEGIEHLPDQVAALREFNRVLKPNGQLLLTTPNYSHIRCRISRLLFDYDYWKRVPPTEIDSVWFSKEGSSNMYFGHLFLLDVQTLYTLSTITGFRVEERVKTKYSTSSFILGSLLFPLLAVMSVLSWLIYRKDNNHVEQKVKDEILWRRVKLNLSATTLFCKQTFWILSKERSQEEVSLFLHDLQGSTPQT